MRHRSLGELTAGNSIRSDLARIRRYYGPALTGPRVVDESGIRSTGSGEPAGLTAIDARAEAGHTLHFWCRFILDEVNGGTITTHVSPDLDSMCTFISRWCDAVIEQYPDDAGNLDREMHEHAWRLECLARGWRSRRVPIGDCPEDVTILTSEGFPKLDVHGKPVRIPCTGRLHAVLRAQDMILPKAIRCDRVEDHQWTPAQFTALGKRLGSLKTTA